MLPLLAPLLSIGVSLVDKLVGKTTDEKDVLKGTLQRMFNEGQTEQLEAEVQRLTLLTQSDSTQSQTTLTSIQRGEAKWRDQLGTVCVVAIAFNFIGVYLVNIGVNITNSLIQAPYISNIPSMNVSDIITLVIGMLGLGGLDFVRRQQSNG